MKQAPFRYGVLAEGPTFTNRAEETRRLVTNFENGINTILVSPRRWGKSSLVKHAAAKVTRRKVRFCFIDLFNIRTEEEFYEVLSREVLKASSARWQQLVKDAGTFFKQLVPKFNVSPDPSAEVSISMDWQEVKKQPSEILDLAEAICKSRNISLVICMDEFQNISFFDDAVGFQKKLRAHWQHHQHVSYCLYGSRRHMLLEFFTEPSMPFYKFGDLLFLEKIGEKHWVPFIKERFRSTGKKITETLALEITAAMENHPYFVQQLAQQVWLMTEESVSARIVAAARTALLQHHHFLFQREVDQLTTPQVNFLGAMIDGVEKFTASDTVKTYKLGTAGNVKRIRESLVNREIIDHEGGRLVFLDPLFKMWLAEVYFGS
ncbi:MAG TPA: hypothetical protein VFZ78_03010 [Flavisolibacter sp.]